MAGSFSMFIIIIIIIGVHLTLARVVRQENSHTCRVKLTSRSIGSDLSEFLRELSKVLFRFDIYPAHLSCRELWDSWHSQRLC